MCEQYKDSFSSNLIIQPVDYCFSETDSILDIFSNQSLINSNFGFDKNNLDIDPNDIFKLPQPSLDVSIPQNFLQKNGWLDKIDNLKVIIEEMMKND